MHSDFQKRVFRIKALHKITKNRGAGQVYKIIKTACQNTAQIHEKWTPELNKKTMLKNIARQIEQYAKTKISNRSQNVTRFPGWRLLGHLWWPQPLLGIKSGPPALPKCFQWSKNKPKIAPKSPPIAKKSSQIQAFSEPDPADCAKRLQ